jgi:hypothetical protein
MIKLYRYSPVLLFFAMILVVLWGAVGWLLGLITLLMSFDTNFLGYQDYVCGIGEKKCIVTLHALWFFLPTAAWAYWLFVLKLIK